MTTLGLVATVLLLTRNSAIVSSSPLHDSVAAHPPMKTHGDIYNWLCNAELAHREAIYEAIVRCQEKFESKKQINEEIECFFETYGKVDPDPGESVLEKMITVVCSQKLQKLEQFEKCYEEKDKMANEMLIKFWNNVKQCADHEHQHK